MLNQYFQLCVNLIGLITRVAYRVSIESGMSANSFNRLCDTMDSTFYFPVALNWLLGTARTLQNCRPSLIQRATVALHHALRHHCVTYAFMHDSHDSLRYIGFSLKLLKY